MCERESARARERERGRAQTRCSSDSLPNTTVPLWILIRGAPVPATGIAAAAESRSERKRNTETHTHTHTHTHLRLGSRSKPSGGCCSTSRQRHSSLRPQSYAPASLACRPLSVSVPLSLSGTLSLSSRARHGLPSQAQAFAAVAMPEATCRLIQRILRGTETEYVASARAGRLRRRR